MTIEQKVLELMNKNAIRSGDMNLKKDFTEAIHYGIQLENERIREGIKYNLCEDDEIDVLSLLDKGTDL